MTTGIYKITNLVNGKVYIGASKNIEKRWGNHKRSVKSPIHSDLEALGEENFKFEVLLECPETMLAQWERDMICLYDADDPEKGYNSKNDKPYSLKNSETHKGKPAWNKGLKNIYSDETRRKISETLKNKPSGHKGHKHTEEARCKMSESLKGRTAWNKGLKTNRPAWNRGIPQSDETKRKKSETMKEIWRKKKEV